MRRAKDAWLAEWQSELESAEVPINQYRIVNELKDKAGGLPSAAGAAIAAAPRGSPSQDAVSALQNLGFKPNVATDAVSRALEELGEGAGLNDLVRVALKRVAG